MSADSPAYFERSTYIFIAVAVATVQLQPETGTVLHDFVFDGEHKKPGWAQRAGGSRQEGRQVAEIHECVGRDDDVEGPCCAARNSVSSD